MKPLKSYIIATRPWSFPVSTMSVIVSSACLYAMGFHFSIWMALWATIGIFLFHAAGNVLSDYVDFCKGVDRADTYCPPTLTSGQFCKREVLTLGLVLLAIACLNGLGIFLCTGWQVLVFGGLGAVLAAGYSWLKYHALGDLDITFEYGIIPALGTSFVLTGAVQWQILWVVPAFVTITNAVLHCNNTRDTASDTVAHIHTLPMLIGKKASIILYDVMMILPYVWIIVCAVIGKLPWVSLLTLVILPKALANCRQMHGFATASDAINNLDERTAQVQLLHTVCLTITLILSVVIHQLAQ